MLPTAGVTNHGLPQNAGRAIEVEEEPIAAAGTVLQHEMRVEQHRLHFRQEVGVAVDVAPSRLHDADAVVGKVVDGSLKKVDRRQEVGVEDGHKFSRRRVETVLKGASLIPGAVHAMNVVDVVPRRPIACAQRRRESRRFVGRVVQHLHLEQVLGIAHLQDLCD